jgi:diguanylate cyclase (GGDEF)-like protein/PAS domain S-box-containing protein
MKTFNIQFSNNTQLLEFIEKSNILDSQNILIQIFSSILDEKKLLEISALLQKKIPSAKIIGTSTAGEIVDGTMFEETILISITTFKSTTVKSKLFNFEKEFQIEEIKDSLITDDTKALIVLSDGLTSNAEEFLKDLTTIVPDIVIAGGRAGDHLSYSKTFIFDHKESTENGVVIASLSGDELIVNSDYMMNWDLIGKEMTVTKSEGNIVYEVDNIKIKDLYRKYLGTEIADNLPASGTEFPLIIMRNGIKVARSVLAILEDDSFLFAGNLKVGERVRFSYGNLNDIKNSLYSNNLKFSELPIESIFIYSCSGRKTLMGKELEVEFKMLNSLGTTAGFFTFGEYFHSSKLNEMLNITTTFLALSENSQSTNKKTYSAEKVQANRVLKALTNLTNVTTKEIEYKNRELFKLNTILSNTVLFTTSDLDGNIVNISKAYLKFLNLTEEDVIGKNHNIFRHPDTEDIFYKEMWKKLSNNEEFIGEIKDKRKNGSDYWLKMTINPIYDDDNKKIGYGSYLEDITDKKLLEYISSHDSLTQIYNRTEFVKRVNAKLKSAQRYNETFGFIICDIDFFKKVNDTYGHKVGDDVLIQVSRCLSENIREDDFLARWGGEEFVIIANYASIEKLILLSDKLKIAMSKQSFTPVPKVTLSFGLTIYKDGDTRDSLLKRADSALYRAKESGRNRYEIA